MNTERWRFQTQPCFLTDAGESKPDAMPCEHLRRPTPEEIGLHEAWRVERLVDLCKVFEAIKPWVDEHRAAGKGGTQVFDCPACGGTKTLTASIAACNGHVHGHCATEHCVSWMQ